MKSIKDLLGNYLTDYEASYNSPPRTITIGGGFNITPADHRINIIGGQPGAGKSAFLGQTAIHMAQEGFRSVILNFEMAERAVVERVFSNLTRLKLEDLKNRNIDPKEVKSRLASHIDCLSRVYLIDASGSREKQVKSEIDELCKDESITYLNLAFFWDYLQRMNIKDGHDERIRINRNLQFVGQITHDYDACSFVAVALNRNGFNKSSLDIFKDSSNIEYDADLAIAMRLASHGSKGWQPVPEEQLPAEKSKAVVNVKFDILKNRHGREGSIIQAFDKTTQSFHDLAEDVAVDTQQEAEIVKRFRCLGGGQTLEAGTEEDILPLFKQRGRPRKAAKEDTYAFL